MSEIVAPFENKTHGLLGQFDVQNTQKSSGEITQLERQDDNPFAYGYSVLNELELVLQKIANSQYSTIQRNASRARDTQDMANRVDEVIAEAAKGDEKTRKQLPEAVINYMNEKAITVDGMSITDYLAQAGGENGSLDKGQLQAVKAALDNSANRDTDLMTQGQLTIQKMSQEINAVITQTTGLLNKWFELLSMIAQKIYS